MHNQSLSNPAFWNEPARDTLTSVNIPLSTVQTTRVSPEEPCFHRICQPTDPLKVYPKLPLRKYQSSALLKVWWLTSTAPSLNECRLWISSSEWWKCPFAKSEMLKFHFLLGLCLLGAGVEGKEGSVTTAEQMKSTFIPNLMSVRLSPIC